MAYSTGPLPVQDTSWLLPHSRTEQRSDLRVERSTAGLTFLSGQERERGHYFLVPATQPVLLEVLWRHNNQEQHQLIEPRPGTTLPIPAEVKTVQLRTVAGDEYELTDQLDKKGRPTPTYLDQTVWQSCVWIPGRLTRATGFFIDPSVIVTSTTAFGSITLGERLEVVWKGKPFTVTLLEANFDSGYVLLELPEGSPSATPLTGEEFLDFERPELDASAPRNWIAYAVLENGQEYWLEGIYRPTLDAQTSSFQVTRSSVPLEELGMPMGLPIFLEGFFLMGQINGWLGERVLIGGTYDAQQALTRLREEHLRKLLSQSTSAPEEISQEEDLSEKEASRRAQDDRLDELRRLILNDGSVKSLILDQLPDQLVDRQITSGRFPSRKHKAFIARIGEISQLSLDLHSMELDSGNTVTIAATAEIDEATLTLPLLHADLFGWSANDADHFLRRPEGWSAEEEEVEAIASLRILVHVQIETDTPEDGMEMISAVHVSAIEDIEIVAVQPQAGPRRRAKAPIRSVATKRSTPRRDPRPSAQKTTSSSSSAPMFDAPVRLFYSYSIRDKALLHRLDTHLEPLKRRGLLSAWRDERIGTRGNWQDQPPKQLEQSNIILLLVSSNFLASKYCSEVEVPAALKRQEEGTAIVVPVLLRDVDRSRTPFAKLRVLPRSEIAVTLWHDEDKALREVAEGLERIIEQELGRRQRP
ncbi:MAG TPA: toll/interleukin-1 receptor domain-containing protein [Myxococcaceae bacterium]